MNSWLPGATVERDCSWGLIGTTVLQVRGSDGAAYIVKAGDADDHHLARELAAHRQWVDVWVCSGQAPRLVRADDEAKLIVTEFLPGELVVGTSYEWALDTYRQAGQLLARFHGQCSVLDDGEFEMRQKESALAWLRRPHRIADDIVALLVDDIEKWPAPPSVVVPTHGDWQPRNWLIDDDVVRVIDFGRADVRPPSTDLARLAAQQFRTMPALETAFFEGYGTDPRQPDAWRRLRIHEAVGTAAWAYKVGDESFEQQGHRMIAEVLADQP